MDQNITKIEAHFHRDDIIKLGEVILLSEKCQYKYFYKVKNELGVNQKVTEQVDGLLILTNCALRFKESSERNRS